jgi:Arc/MetJ family transcription regulator
MKRQVHHKALLFSGLLLATVAAGTGGFLYAQKDLSKPTLSTVSGLQDGDSLSVNIAVGQDYYRLEDIEARNDGTRSVKAAKTKDGEKEAYNLLYTINPGNDYKDVSDISLYYDPQARLIEASATGLPRDAQTSLRVGKEDLFNQIPADWSGKSQLRATLEPAQVKEPVCLDIGGYRGGTLTICHDPKAMETEEVLLGGLSGLIGGGLGGLFGGAGPQLFLDAMKPFTEQINAAAIQQVSASGKFLDAKHQLETQRLLQQLYARAVKDYHPSEQMCAVGTMVRNLAQSESNTKLAKVALNEVVQARELVEGAAMTISGPFSDKHTRLEELKKYNCEKFDFGGELVEFCPGDVEAANQNMDIDYTSALEIPLTLDIDFIDPEVTDDERNAFLFLHSIFNSSPYPYITPASVGTETLLDPYQDLRSISSMRSVARNALSNIIAQKVSGPVIGDAAETAAPYLRGLMHDFGLSETEITAMIGENPSYFSQMELLTKKMYQNPNFYTELYTKPANIKRIRAAMKAIKLMQDRDIYNALLRREMLISMLLETDVRDIQGSFEDNIKRMKSWE